MLTPKDVLEYVEGVFIKKLIAAILKEMKIIQDKRWVWHAVSWCA